MAKLARSVADVARGTTAGGYILVAVGTTVIVVTCVGIGFYKRGRAGEDEDEQHSAPNQAGEAAPGAQAPPAPGDAVLLTFEQVEAVIASGLRSLDAAQQVCLQACLCCEVKFLVIPREFLILDTIDRSSLCCRGEF